MPDRFDLLNPVNPSIPALQALLEANSDPAALGTALIGNSAAASFAGLNSGLNAAGVGSSSINASSAVDFSLLNSTIQSAVNTDFAENILSAYHQVAYHFKLYAASEQGSGSVVVAESGKTTFNIREVTFEGKVAPGPTNHNVAQTKMRIVIAEPSGVSFLDALYLAAKRHNVSNWQKAPYTLELSFMGYDENGGVVPNICQSLSNGGFWRWAISIIDIDTHFDASGGLYTLTCIPYWQTAQAPEISRIQEGISFPASTIGEALQTLGAEMTKSSQKRDKVGLHTYSFKVSGGNLDPSGWKFVEPDQDKGRNPFVHLSMSKDKKEIPVLTFSGGTGIPEMITALIGLTAEGQAVIRDSKNPKLGAKDAISGFRDSIVWMTYTDVQVAGFDNQTKNYKKAITINVKAFTTQGIVADPSEYDQAESTSAQAIAKLKSIGGLKKKYEYLFTGLNTEVIRCDMRFNLAWQAIAPRFDGDVVYNSQVETSAKYNSQRAPEAGMSSAQAASAATGIAGALGRAASSTLGGALGNAGTALNGVLSGLGGASGIGNVVNTAISGVLGSNPISSALGNAATSALSRAITPANRTAGSANAMSGGGMVAPSGRVEYAEMLLDEQTPAGVTTITSKSYTGESFRHNAGAGLQSQYHRGKALYGAMLEQLYGPVSTALSTISIDIKGDPYWLGQDLPAMVAAGPGSDIANFTMGDAGFTLRLRYPNRFGELGQQTQFREQDVFNGVYRTTEVTSTFVDGQFTQTLKAMRLPNIKLGNQGGSSGSSAAAFEISAINRFK